MGEYGADVVWTDEIDISADSLYRLAQEPSGKTTMPEELRRRRKRRAYPLDTAARARGIRRRMAAYHEHG